MIIKLAIILKKLELFNKKLPSKDAVKPKLMNTKEKPKLKKIVFVNIISFFFLVSFSNEVLEI